MLINIKGTQKKQRKSRKQTKKQEDKYKMDCAKCVDWF